MKRSLIFLATLTLSIPAFADTMAWVATGINQFGSVDLNTGAYTQVADLGFTPAGLGEIGNTVYTAEANGYTLDKVNTSTGAVTAVGNSVQSFYSLGSTTTGLYMVNDRGDLFSVNATTGASSYIGSTLINMGANTYGLSTGSSTLYIAVGSTVYTINTRTGLGTAIGSTAPNMYGAMVDVQGTVYGTSITAPNQTYTFNPTTGTSSLLANTGVPGYAWGLAAQVPEPSSFAFLGLASTLLAGFALKRKRA